MGDSILFVMMLAFFITLKVLRCSTARDLCNAKFPWSFFPFQIPYCITYSVHCFTM